MIWNIFKKDLRLLWWLAIPVAAIHLAQIAVLLHLGLFPQHLPGMTFDVCWMTGVAFTIVALVHQDAIPGVTQDWLVRPIRRRDLLLAKLLFVILLVQFPILMIDLLEGVASGFSIGASLVSAAARSFYLLVILDIPLLAFASLTRNLLEAIAAAVAIVCAAVGWQVYGAFQWLGSFGGPTAGSGIDWLTDVSGALVIVAGAALVLALEFIRRRTVLARWLTGAVVLLLPVSTFMPWRPAFAIQRALASVPGAGNNVTVTFDPPFGRYKTSRRLTGEERSLSVYLPVSISGLPGEAALRADRSETRLIEPGGMIDSIRDTNFGDRGTRSSDEEKSLYQQISVPLDLYRRIGSQPVRIEIDYSLTLFHQISSQALPAGSSALNIPDVGRCATKLFPIFRGQTLVLSCIQAGKPPGCLMVTRESSSGRQDLVDSDCNQADYAPYRAPLFPESLWRFGTGFAHGDYPYTLRAYQPVDHFSRTLLIPDVRLTDWAAEISAP